MMTELSPFALALQRAMPVTRLLDCGMDYADAVALHARTSAGEPWDVAAEVLADAQLARATQAADAGHLVTAADAQAMAIADLLFAQMAFNHDVPRKRALYTRLVDASHDLARWSDKRIERVEVPFDAARLIGWLVHPATERVRGTVIVFGGQSGWGFAYWPIARALAARGVATLLAEGPGQGETRLEQRVFVDVDMTAAYRRFVDHVAERVPGAIGIWGNSIGGLWAASTAAADERIAACCVNGALAAPTLLPFRTFVEQAAAMLGNDDPEAVATNFTRMRFSSERNRIACPLLVLHGGEDPLIRLDDQQPFLDAATSGDATLRIWPDGEHTIYNHASERTAFVCDWFVERLARA
ncbi:alpha/beta fold hydrolase [Burkholderia cenocepacia]|uniref:alpha/beta hydrolase n=1 Tax=Burkholderia cepacia complex TaxID=87882 RepID=UPI000F588A2C|nr:MULTISPECIES: alpha/beta fold hydrolase [Burkholderia cepacia complex]ELW9445688.1 alpha/beta fold hydrolase [Burkholderia cenocepacia]MBR8481661.1 alpha/beta fold hydrolase [Burkholderia cenocepacia]MDN7469297.1 alpha/beta fold hydrolase [Burkholderia orbicola]MDN7503431.1 alpha/beta fold hydrolase [Burkholderia orbicola]RQU10925.1 alpha/beta fold hydrolase [Burkholderia cenocepacia]